MKLKIVFLFLVFFLIVANADADTWTYNSKNYSVWTNQTGFYESPEKNTKRSIA